MRKVEFVPDSSKIHADPADVARLWLLHAPSYIPAQYAVGTAQHETDFTTNEKDTEESNFVSMGIFQISQEEMTHVGMPTANIYDLEDSIVILAALADERWQAIVKAAGSPSPIRDMPAYLALAHNQGLAAALKTIRLHGLDWTAYKARNPQLASMAAYGDDCISGGEKWRPEFGAPTPAPASGSKIRCSCCKKLFDVGEIYKGARVNFCRPCEEHIFARKSGKGIAFVIPKTCPDSKEGPAGPVD